MCGESAATDRLLDPLSAESRPRSSHGSLHNRCCSQEERKSVCPKICGSPLPASAQAEKHGPQPTLRVGAPPSSAGWPVSVRRPMRRAGAPPPRPLVHLRARMLSTGRPEPRPKPRPVSGLSLGSSSTLCGRGRRLWKGGRHGLPTAWTTEGRLAAGRYSLRPRAETVERGGQRQ